MDSAGGLGVGGEAHGEWLVGTGSRAGQYGRSLTATIGKCFVFSVTKVARRPPAVAAMM